LLITEKETKLLMQHSTVNGKSFDCTFSPSAVNLKEVSENEWAIKLIQLNRFKEIIDEKKIDL